MATRRRSPVRAGLVALALGLAAACAGPNLFTDLGSVSTGRSNRGRIRTRSSAASGAAPAPAKAAVDADFQRQLGALEKAEESFDEAASVSPSAPQDSRGGKEAVRRNADLLDDLGL